MWFERPRVLISIFLTFLNISVDSIGYLNCAAATV